MFWISELSGLIAGVKRRVASVGLNTSDFPLLFEDVAEFHHQIYYLFTYFTIHLPSWPEGSNNIFIVFIYVRISDFLSFSFIALFFLVASLYVSFLL
jgi:hypothetical protein